MPTCSGVSGGAQCQYDAAGLGASAGVPIFVAVTAYDHSAPPNESAFSNEISLTP